MLSWLNKHKSPHLVESLAEEWRLFDLQRRTKSGPGCSYEGDGKESTNL